MAPREDAPHRLLVEGKDDKWVVINLLARHGVDWNAGEPTLPFIHDCDSAEKLLRSIPTCIKSFQRLGILLDADLDVGDRWKQVSHYMGECAKDLPPAPPPGGCIVDRPSAGKKIGVWLMPDNSSPGKLEDFLSRLVPAEDACWPHAESSTNQAATLGAPFRAIDFTKAHIHTWLAWQEPPGQPFGTALTAHSFNHDSPDARDFVVWFKRLFLEQSPENQPQE